MALTDARIRSLKPGSRDRWVGDGKGLWLRVRTGGSKVFVIRTKRGGRTKIITLGEWPDTTLAAARLEASKVANDRAGHALRTLEPITVKELAEEYFDRHIQGVYRRTKSARTYRDRLIAELGWRPVSQVLGADVSAFTKAYARTAPVAANRCLSFVKAVFAYAVELGYLQSSPVALINRRAAGGEEVARDRILTDTEIRAVWHAPGAHQRLLRFLLLTGARIGEAQRTTWSQVDLPGRRWHIPKAQSKNKRDHWVHLSALALDTLGTAGAAHELALRSRSETAVQAWLRRWCEREDIAPAFTPHDLRRTFATRLGDLGVAPHVIKKCINHVLEEGSALPVYLRSEFEAERVAATERWSAELQRLVVSA